jgi:gamma-glutamyl phosphate reductase
MYDYQNLAELYENAKVENKAKCEYMETLLLEKEEELRVIEEIRYYAEDQNV